MRARQLAERLSAPALAVATLALLSLMFFYPVGIVLVEAVRVDGAYSLATVVEVLRDPFYFGVFAQALDDPGVVVRSFPDYRLGLFGFTAYQALLSTVAAIALGLPGAYVLARFEFPGRRTIRSLTALPFVMPTILVAIGFVATFGANGVVTGALQSLGLRVESFTGTLGIIVLAHAFYDAPLIARITAASWEGIDAEMTETARSLGASPLRAFRDVVVPQLLPAILTGALLTFIFSFMSFAIVLALGGLSLATVEVWVYHRISQLDYGTASTLATMEMLFSLALTYAYLRYEARQRATGAARPPDRIDLLGPATKRRLFAWGYAVVALVVFVVPIVSLVLASVTGPEGVTLRNYRFLVDRQTSAYAFQVKPLTAVTNSQIAAASMVPRPARDRIRPNTGERTDSTDDTRWHGFPLLLQKTKRIPPNHEEIRTRSHRVCIHPPDLRPSAANHSLCHRSN